MKKDLILIGMPGCGKSTFGRKLAKKMGMPFLDLDEKIEETTGKTIPELFAEEGEDGFRRWETRVFAEAVKGGRVIATGGGIVTRPENREIAKRGSVIFIDRPLNRIIEDVRCDTRPLLADGREHLKKLYAERIDLYREWADCIIPNEGSFGKVLNQILNEVSDDETDGN